MDEIDKIMAEATADLDYKVNWKAVSIRPGRHKSKVRGSGFDFKGVVPITDADKFDKLDPMASLQAIDKIPRVRVVDQKSGVKVILVADLSASIAWQGLDSKKREMARLAAVLGYSAYRSADAFGFIAYGDDAIVSARPVRSKSAGFNAGSIIWNSGTEWKGHAGLKDVGRLLPKEHALIFWFSDFYFPATEIEDFLESVSKHTLYAVSFADNAEIAIPKFGLFRVGDSESGESRAVFMRPFLRKRMISEAEEREKKLASMFEDNLSDIYFVKGKADLEDFQNWLLT